MTQALTCFLIDDDEDDREIFIMALEGCNSAHRCVTATNGKDALQKLNADPIGIPDFIFLDLNMPIMNGKQFLKERSEIAHIAAVPVIIYTTSSYEKDIQEAQQLGAAHFLIKPSSIAKLEKILSRLFQNEVRSFILD